MPKIHTYYDTLSVVRNAPPEVIRAAYKILSQKYHPDRNANNPSATATMVKINEAYTWLSNPDKRKKYDSWLADQESSMQQDEKQKNEENKIKEEMQALFDLGKAYHKGIGKTADKFQAVAYYRKAAEKGHAAAQNNLGTMYEDGEGVKKDEGQAVFWYRKAAQQGLTSAQNNLKRFVICPNCKADVKPKQEPKGSAGTFLVLLLFYIIPGLIYAVIYRGYKTVCPKCAQTIDPNIREVSEKQKQVKQPVESSSSIGWMTGIGIFIWLIWFGSNSEKSSSTPANNTPAPVVQPAAATPEFNQPEQPLPQTGDNNATFQDGVAPLTIKTSSAGGYHYFVKIVNLLNNQPIGAYFIRSGEIIDIKVPLGTYEIKYASGTKWYGIDYLFGAETTYSKADSTFDFTFDGSQYSGYTIELIMQRNGNLRTTGIQSNQW